MFVTNNRQKLHRYDKIAFLKSKGYFSLNDFLHSDASGA